MPWLDWYNSLLAQVSSYVSRIVLKCSSFPATETELKLIAAAAATIGLNRGPICLFHLRRTPRQIALAMNSVFTEQGGGGVYASEVRAQ